MKLAGLVLCLLVTAVAVYPEAPASKGTASRTTLYAAKTPRNLDAALLNEEMVGGWLRTWQQRLGLQEWRVEAKIVRLKQLQKGTLANIHWSLPKRAATIRILDPVDSSLPASEIVRDTELSVVHELIHLSMARLPLDGSDTEIEEEAVKRIASALIALDKQDEARR